MGYGDGLRIRDLIIRTLLGGLLCLSMGCSDDPDVDPDPTDTETQKPTDEPTDEPTDAPTDEPTDQPTDGPIEPPVTPPEDPLYIYRSGRQVLAVDAFIERGDLEIRVSEDDEFGCVGRVDSQCEGTYVVCTEENGLLTVTAQCAEDEPDCRTDVLVLAPTRVAVRAKLEEGDLKIGEIGGLIEGNLDNGAVDLNGTFGPIALEVEKGSITGQRLRSTFYNMRLNEGIASVSLDLRPVSFDLTVGRGSAAVVVPSGAYNLDLKVDFGAPPFVYQVTDDPDSDESLTVLVENGSMQVTGQDREKPELDVYPDWLIEPKEGTFYEFGVGAPAVAFDEKTNLWVMFFETRIEEPSDRCRSGKWVIGRATSADGFEWDIDPEPVVTPQDGTYYSCVAAQPAVVYDNGDYRLWFKSHQNSDACADTTKPEPPWGCPAITGIGQATSDDGKNFRIDGLPAVNLPRLGFPSVVKIGGLFRMVFAHAPQGFIEYDVFTVVSTDNGMSWSDPRLMVKAGPQPWVKDEIFNPALTCAEDYPQPLVMWAGGRNKDSEGVVNEIALGLASSGLSYFWHWDYDNPAIQFDLEDDPLSDWRHWDALRQGGDYIIVFSQRDKEGRNRIGLATSRSNLGQRIDNRTLFNKVCLEGRLDFPVRSEPANVTCRP